MSERTPTPEWMVPCEQHLKAIHEKIDRLDESIRGNGKPGILLRVDRLEQSARQQGKWMWMIIGALATSISGALVAWMVGGRL